MEYLQYKINSFIYKCFKGGIALALDRCTKLDINLGVTSQLMKLTSKYKNSSIKIVHNHQLEPFAYAIGFGDRNNANVITGSINSFDYTTALLLLDFADRIGYTLKNAHTINGFNLSELINKKGLWIIPNFSELEDNTSAENFIIEKLNPCQLLELTPTGESIKYACAKHNQINTKLQAFMLSASSGYPIDNNKTTDYDNSLIKWFTLQTNRSALSIGYDNSKINPQKPSLPDNILESLLLFAFC